MLRLARERFPRMPLFPGHPTFEVLSYRSPQGIRAAGDTPWGPVGNTAGLGYMSELVMGTTHSGAHIDAHAHMTVGAEDHWNGGSAQRHLGDFGPLRGDATEIPPLWRRGVLYDLPGQRGVEHLGRGEPVGSGRARARSRRRRAWRRRPATWRSCAPATCVTGPTRSGWPSTAGPVRTSPPRVCSPIAAWSPSAPTPRPSRCSPRRIPASPSNPQPVHTLLLIERGIYIMESLDLEGLAGSGAREFLFVALPLAIRGATGSMIDPVAVI